MEEILWKIKGFLTEPTKTFRKVKKERIGEGIKYYALLALIYSILDMVGTLHYGSKLTPPTVEMFTGLGVIITIIFMYVGMFVWVFIGSMLLHLFVWVLGGKMGYEETLKSCLYGSTPVLLFGWIASISNFFPEQLALVILGIGITVMAAIWTLLLNIIGLSELQKMSRGKAFLAIMLEIVVILVFAALTGFWLLSIMETSNLGMSPNATAPLI